MARAGVIIIEAGRVALIERHRNGRHYFVVPGGGVETGETSRAAAYREAREELGVEVELVSLAVQLGEGPGTHHYYRGNVIGGTFGAGMGPEMAGQYPPESGTFKAVWVETADLVGLDVRPRGLCNLITSVPVSGWPEETVVIL
ncbi:MAG: NUDIX domain-containing protein [Planctomycetota bacterium]|jgi:8-oxo-dGTP pyrophosphatase MutT (NUDIX family)|nr:NUDIX domain-containing protein [Planctomycetota bacterium]